MFLNCVRDPNYISFSQFIFSSCLDFWIRRDMGCDNRLRHVTFERRLVRSRDLSLTTRWIGFDTFIFFIFGAIIVQRESIASVRLISSPWRNSQIFSRLLLDICLFFRKSEAQRVANWIESINLINPSARFYCSSVFRFSCHMKSETKYQMTAVVVEKCGEQIARRFEFMLLQHVFRATLEFSPDSPTRNYLLVKWRVAERLEAFSSSESHLIPCRLMS